MPRPQPNNEDHQWLLDALGGRGSGPSQVALARPSADKPELFIPLTPPKVAATSLRRHHDGHGLVDQAKVAGALLAARTGTLRFAPGDEVAVGPYKLVEQLAQVMERPDLRAAITLGPRRRNRKPVLQLINSDGTSLGFAKVGWSPFTRALVANEAKWLERLAGKAPTGLVIPRIITRIDEPDRLVVVSSPLRTSPSPFSDKTLTPATVIDLARALGSSRVCFDDLPSLPGMQAGRVGELVDITRLKERHEGTVVEVGLWHGDLTPWNTSTSGGRSQVWDWEFADDGQPVGFDLLHCAFERVRRSQPNSEAAALRAVAEQAPSLLESIGQPIAAVVDLYLCEIIQREARLRGEGWLPSDLGPLESHAVALLRERLS